MSIVLSFSAVHRFSFSSGAVVGHKRSHDEAADYNGNGQAKGKKQEEARMVVAIARV